MWAHAEYVKLLRSAVDGHVFDRISVVADRYLSNGGRQDLEIWTRDRRPGEIRAGDVLRIQAASPFRVHWTCDEDVSSQSSSLGISWHDIQVNKTQEAPVRFTLYWPERDAWEGCDYSVRVRSGD
jgi:glucoamylase